MQDTLVINAVNVYPLDGAVVIGKANALSFVCSENRRHFVGRHLGALYAAGSETD